MKCANCQMQAQIPGAPCSHCGREIPHPKPVFFAEPAEVSVLTLSEEVEQAEEVEEAVKSHPDVYDCLVVGVSDERFGERVTAVTSFLSGKEVGEKDLIAWLHGKLAGYKLPRSIVAVPEVQRAANGKADYKWAKETAVERVG